MPIAPAGWFPDPRPEAPEGQLRWWDGEAWTSWLAPAGTEQTPPAPALHRAVPDDVRVDRMWRAAGIVAGCLALVLLVMAVAGVVSQRRVPQVSFSPAGPASTGPSEHHANDMVLDETSGHGRIGSLVRFQLPAAPFRTVTKPSVPDSLVSAATVRSLTGDASRMAEDSFAAVGVVQTDVLTDQGYRQIAPTLLRVLASNLWDSASVGELNSSDADQGPDHPGTLVHAPVTLSDGSTPELSLQVVRMRTGQWVAWWDVRRPGLAASSAAALDAARAALQVKG